MIEAEERGELISRTIVDEWETPMGTISLYDIKNGCGLLATWLGNPYFGKGYNQRAKEIFFTELFYEKEIETIFLKIRKGNIRSKKAAEKLPYVTLVNELCPNLYNQINKELPLYDIYQIKKDLYTLQTLRQQTVVGEQMKEA